MMTIQIQRSVAGVALLGESTERAETAAGIARYQGEEKKGNKGSERDNGHE
jgi:hypothetical protein